MQPQVIKVQADADGNFPVRLYGTDYLIQPVKTKRAATASKNKATSAQPSQEELGQPLNDTPQQDPNNTEA